MIIIIGIFGFISALALFIEAIMLMTSGAVWFGIGLLLSVLYIVALTVVLIRVDGRSTENQNKIAKLETQLENLKKQLNISIEEIKEENEFEDVAETNVETSLPEGVKLCEFCGYQLFPEDKVCPNCKKEIK
ncbi:MAG: hypothetical protein K2O89_05950 [Clostridia bacterium]|nr:hypothetical protein [Clostridia bacterium]